MHPDTAQKILASKKELSQPSLAWLEKLLTSVDSQWDEMFKEAPFALTAGLTHPIWFAAFLSTVNEEKLPRLIASLEILWQDKQYAWYFQNAKKILPVYLSIKNYEAFNESVKDIYGMTCTYCENFLATLMNADQIESILGSIKTLDDWQYFHGRIRVNEDLRLPSVKKGAKFIKEKHSLSFHWLGGEPTITSILYYCRYGICDSKEEQCAFIKELSISWIANHILSAASFLKILTIIQTDEILVANLVKEVGGMQALQGLLRISDNNSEQKKVNDILTVHLPAHLKILYTSILSPQQETTDQDIHYFIQACALLHKADWEITFDKFKLSQHLPNLPQLIRQLTAIGDIKERIFILQGGIKHVQQLIKTKEDFKKVWDLLNTDEKCFFARYLKFQFTLNEIMQYSNGSQALKRTLTYYSHQASYQQRFDAMMNRHCANVVKYEYLSKNKPFFIPVMELIAKIESVFLDAFGMRIYFIRYPQAQNTHTPTSSLVEEILRECAQWNYLTDRFEPYFIARFLQSKLDKIDAQNATSFSWGSALQLRSLGDTAMRIMHCLDLISEFEEKNPILQWEICKNPTAHTNSRNIR